MDKSKYLHIEEYKGCVLFARRYIEEWEGYIVDKISEDLWENVRGYENMHRQKPVIGYDLKKVLQNLYKICEIYEKSDSDWEFQKKESGKKRAKWRL